jgi:large repetitive protein
MSAYLSAVIADSPVHYWRMADPGGGLAHDIGSAPIHLHGLGTAISQPLGYSGPISDGGSMDLCLDGQYANTGNPITIAVSAFSIEMWYWNWQRLSSLGLLMQVQPTNQIALYRNGTGWQFLYNSASVISTTHYTSQAWHHIVATYDGTNMRLYVDALAAGPTAIAPQSSIATLMELGANQALSGNWGNGFFAEVAIYSVALSPTQVTNHFIAADQSAQSPINNASAAVAPPYTSLQNEILAAVRKTYQNAT